MFLTAPARDLNGVWERSLPSGGRSTSAADIRIQNNSQHGADATSNRHSFVSVPTLHYDTAARLWRAWFVTEDQLGAPIRYSESDDDGQSCGVQLSQTHATREGRGPALAGSGTPRWKPTPSMGC